jgi:hypothetical protein
MEREALAERRTPQTEREASAERRTLQKEREASVERRTPQMEREALAERLVIGSRQRDARPHARDGAAPTDASKK